LPNWIATPAKWIYHKFKRDWWAVTTGEIMEELGVKGKLKVALTYQWGYYGSAPSKSSFAIHALTQSHFFFGEFYPKGGAKMIAETFMYNVLEAKGQVCI
jgi:all-trans-retinol 13,14-reductase